MSRCYRCSYPGGGPCPCGYSNGYGAQDEHYHREQISMLREIMYRLERLERTQYHPYGYEPEIKNAAKKKEMKTLGVMMKKLLDGDTQTLIKAGYINGDLEFTTEGTSALDSVIFDANKAALVALAQAKLDEEKKK